jgi:hypothetical protein
LDYPNQSSEKCSASYMREDDEFFEKENGLATREVYDK